MNYFTISNINHSAKNVTVQATFQNSITTKQEFVLTVMVKAIWTKVTAANKSYIHPTFLG
jgi:hypothetical protein